MDHINSEDVDMQNSEMKISREILIEMLGYALLEIRASSDLSLTRALADIFHNMPPYITKNGLGDFDARIAFDKLLKKAEKNNLSTYLLALRETAERSIGDQ